MHSHSHDHSHDHSQHHHHHHSHMSGEKRLLWAIILTGGFMCVEVVGAVLSSSLALFSDAFHMLSDFSSLILALVAARMTKKPSDHKRSYGYHRIEVLAALFNGLSLLLIVAWIIYEAIHRLMDPAEVQGEMMLSVAFIGLVVNCVVFAILHRKHERNLNMKGAVIHVIGDLLSSVAAIVAAIVILYTGWMPIDPLLSIVVSLLILKSGISITNKAIHILLEGTPEPHLVDQVKSVLKKEFTEITDVHHIHIWSLTSDKPVVTLHISVRENIGHDELLLGIKKKLAEHFGMTHSTVQIETEGFCPDDEPCHSVSHN